MDKIKLTSYIKDIGLKNKMFKIIDKANGCLKNYDVRYSDFLNPFEVENAKAILNSNDDLEKMVEKEKEKYGWEFLFLGANIDAIEVAGRVGIGADRASIMNATEKELL